MKLDYDTPSKDLHRIQSYGPDFVTVNGQRLRHSLILTPTLLLPDWPPRTPQELQEQHLHELLKLKADLVLLGTGARQYFPPPELLLPFGQAGIGVEVMDTGAACRSYNVLAIEGRQVAAGLILAQEYPETHPETDESSKEAPGRDAPPEAES